MRCLPRALWLGFAALLCLPASARADLRAERITAQTAPDLLIGGTQAVGGVGDWYLANDVVEIIVDDPANVRGELPHGGTLIDAGLRDRRDEDQLGQVLPVLNMDARVQVRFDTIRAEVNDAEGWARLVVAGSHGATSVDDSVGFTDRLLVPPPEALRQVYVETEFRVVRGEPYVHMTTTIANRGDTDAPVFAYSDVVIHGEKGPRAWFGNTLAPEKSVGFDHKRFVVSEILNADESIAPLTYAAFPGTRFFPSIAYGLCDPERADGGRPLFGVTDGHVGPITAFLFEPDWQEVTGSRILLATRRTLGAGQTWEYHRLLLIAGRHDVGAITDIAFPLLGYADGTSGLTGSVEPGDVPHVIHVREMRTGRPVTQLSAPTAGPDAGRFHAILPPGQYTLELRAPQRPPRFLEVTVPIHTFAEIGPQRLPEPGWLRFERAFTDGGPGRIIVQGIEGTPDPRFGPEMLDFRLNGQPEREGMERRALSFVGTDADPVQVAIPPGKYRLTATRGLEYGVDSHVIAVEGAGAVARVPAFNPPRVIELRDYMTADFHVHSEASDDSGITNAARLAGYVAEQMDVLVSTEHDNVGHFGPALDALGVRKRIVVVPGTEMTGATASPDAPWGIGHSNVWPVDYDPIGQRHGAPPSENVSLADAYAIARRDHGVEVVQLNHPRSGTPEHQSESQFLTHMGTAGVPFDPELPVSAAPNNHLLRPSRFGPTRAIDFDAIEVLNGDGYAQYLQVRADWHSLLRQGYLRTGLANSDTHDAVEAPAYPRNYVEFPTGLAGWDRTAFDRAVREGRAFGTSGPLFVRFAANGGRMGDTVPAPDGRVTVAVTVAAAPWIPVDEVRVLVNGEVRGVFTDLPHLEGAPVIRFERDVELEVDRDAFITLEAGAALGEDPTALPAPPGGVYNVIAGAGFLPVAFTNPIYVDTDGNGRFDPPGIPPKPPGWTMNIALYVFGGLLAYMVIGLLIARRQA